MSQKLTDMYLQIIDEVGRPDQLPGGVARLLEVSEFARRLGRDVKIGIGRQAMEAWARTMPDASDRDVSLNLTLSALHGLDNRPPGHFAAFFDLVDPRSGRLSCVFMSFHPDADTICAFSPEDIGASNGESQWTERHGQRSKATQRRARHNRARKAKNRARG